MRNPLFTLILKGLLGIFAVVHFVELVASPSSLSLDAAARHEVVAHLIQFKRTEQRVSLQVNGEHIDHLSCVTAWRLCELLREAPDWKMPLSVWITKPGYFQGTWLVAAGQGDANLITLHDQNQLYRRGQVYLLVVCLVLVSAALFVWRRKWLKLFGNARRPS
jgi:hypothetical protein